MGKGGSRFGAGRPGWHVRAEHCLGLNVQDLARRNLMGGGSFAWRWSNAVTGEPLGSISVTTRADALWLSFSSNGTPVSQDVRIVRTACNYGGSRPWFQCPRCGRRVAVLFLRSGNFMCRHCGRVAYASQSADAMGRAWIKQRKLERRLADGWQRPKGMHSTTYSRIISGIVDCEEARDAALCAFIQRNASLLGLKR
jgi:hypothetical protein